MFDPTANVGGMKVEKRDDSGRCGSCLNGNRADVPD